ncbi:hypothetical protein, partial [Salegentibacter salarius]|uniref:hypothetical protein n=1 Tax=Salegentibacter salarius TaxID=435906 RepID=UPI001F3FE47C
SKTRSDRGIQTKDRRARSSLVMTVERWVCCLGFIVSDCGFKNSLISASYFFSLFSYLFPIH